VEGTRQPRRHRGYANKRQGAFSEVRKQRYVSTEIAIEWAGLAPSVPQRTRRLGIVIRFAR